MEENFSNFCCFNRDCAALLQSRTLHRQKPIKRVFFVRKGFIFFGSFLTEKFSSKRGSRSGRCDIIISEPDIDIDVEILQKFVILRCYWYWNFLNLIIVIDIGIENEFSPLPLLILILQDRTSINIDIDIGIAK